MKNKFVGRTVLFLAFGFLIVCRGLAGQEKRSQQEPDYPVVFPQDKVNTLYIAMSAEQWDSVQADMKHKYRMGFGERKGQGMRPPGGGPGPMQRPLQGIPEVAQGMPPSPGLRLGSADPNYIMVRVRFNSKTWKQVGFRLKGNSSLMALWSEGSYKLPFRLDFNAFRTAAAHRPESDFHGFRGLTMSPAFSDQSLIREKVTADIFRMSGIGAAQTAFYRIFIDFGKGYRYCGVYTAVEVIDDTMLKSQFGTNAGNLYKPESNLRQFNKHAFEKKNHKKEADYSDIVSFIQALNDSTRKTEPALWRRKLESVFNVNHFLKWLAVNTTIENWDSYGAMAHNYYLYNDPVRKLTWIPWDHNMALGFGMQPDRQPYMEAGRSPMNFPPPAGAISGAGPGRERRGFGGMGRAVTLELTDVSDNWPLIRYLADDPVYFSTYRNYVREFTANVFTGPQMEALFTRYTQLITPYVTGKRGEKIPWSNLRDQKAFEGSLAQLIGHVEKRREAVNTFLEKTEPR